VRLTELNQKWAWIAVASKRRENWGRSTLVVDEVKHAKFSWLQGERQEDARKVLGKEKAYI